MGSHIIQETIPPIQPSFTTPTPHPKTIYEEKDYKYYYDQ